MFGTARLPTARVVPRVQLHPYNVQSQLLSFCKTKGITITGFSPLGARYTHPRIIMCRCRTARCTLQALRAPVGVRVSAAAAAAVAAATAAAAGLGAASSVSGARTRTGLVAVKLMLGTAASLAAAPSASDARDASGAGRCTQQVVCDSAGGRGCPTQVVLLARRLGAGRANGRPRHPADRGQPQQVPGAGRLTPF